MLYQSQVSTVMTSIGVKIIFKKYLNRDQIIIIKKQHIRKKEMNEESKLCRL